jgi:hypothetical protein
MPGEDDATEILGQERDAGSRTDPADTITEIHLGPPTVKGTVVAPRPSRGKTWPLSRWIAVGVLSIALSILLVYYIFNRQPPAIDKAQAQADAYRNTLTLAELAIDEGEVDTLPALLLSQARMQPDNADIRALLRDATHYRDMLYLQQSGRLLDLAEARRAHTFHSTLFEQAARHHIDGDLGSPALIQHLTSAGDAWRTGELVAAITAVKQLATERGNAQAEAMLHHYSRVVKDYETLSGQATDPAYPQALLAFYLGLDPLQDQFFWGRLESDFKLARDLLADNASQQLQHAGHLWGSYHSHGGIDGRMRQNFAVNNEFRQRAGELTEANRLAREVASLLQPLPGQAGKKTTLFLTLIDKEMLLQRDRLEALRRFNDEAVLASRLLMLPADPARQH